MSPDSGATEPWQVLLGQALVLLDAASESAGEPIEWTFGGGTVLMLELHHRRSKDIDIFISDPQLLGFFSPRTNDAALAVTPDYDEGPQFVKLLLEAGEIDVVVAVPLTEGASSISPLLGRGILIERPAEIIAKKMWHRGDRARARDLFDLAAVAELAPAEIEHAEPYLARNAAEFLRQVDLRQAILRAEFDAIDRLDFARTFDECRDIARSVLAPHI